MFAYRLVGLFLVAGFLAVAAVSAQPGVPKGVKVQPGVKPNVPMIPNIPGVPGKNPVPGIPGIPGIPGVPAGGNPGLPIPLPTPGVPVAPPPEKKDLFKWPTELGGKTLEAIVKDMRTNTDPAVREASIRTLPGFGPKAREFGGSELVAAMTKDLDWNVRMAALNVGPIILLGYAKAPDALLNDGFAVIVNYLSHEFMHVRYDAIGVVASIGPYIRKLQPAVVQKLTSCARMANSWQMRRAAVAAMANVGLGDQPGDNPDMRDPPDAQTVTALLDILKSDQCAAVRREAVNSLIALGPVAPVQQKTWKPSIDNLFKLNLEKDKSVLLWARVLLIRNSPDGLKGNEGHLDAITRTLEVPEAAGRIEACAAIAALGEEAKSKLGNLIDIINNAKEEHEVVTAAIMATTAIPSKSAVSVPILIGVKTNHKSPDVKKVAEEAIEILSGGKKKK